ncbi:hypothetical protein SCALM49S_03064 [Streptomyces californicus]
MRVGVGAGGGKSAPAPRAAVATRFGHRRDRTPSSPGGAVAEFPNWAVQQGSRRLFGDRITSGRGRGHRRAGPAGSGGRRDPAPGRSTQDAPQSAALHRTAGAARAPGPDPAVGGRAGQCPAGGRGRLALAAATAGHGGARKSRWPWRRAPSWRAEYARTVRPYLGYRGSWRKGLLAEGKPARRVGILNGGQHIAVVDSWECRVVLRGVSDEASAPWAASLVSTLTAAGSRRAGLPSSSLRGGFPLSTTRTPSTAPTWPP